MESQQLSNQENGSTEQPPNQPQPLIENTVAKGIQRSFSAASNLGNFLPTGTNLIFESFLPTIYKNGQCSTLSTVMMGVILGTCAIFCFVSSFTDSVELPEGLVYGFVTSKGLWVYKKKTFTDQKYMLEFVDVLHAVMSVLVFLAIAISDHRVIECLFPRYVNDVEQAMQSLVLIVAFVCSALFLLFPVYRRGFVPSLPRKASQ